MQSREEERERKKRDRGRFQFDNTDQLVVAEILALPADDHQQRTATAMAETAQSLNAIEEQLKQLTKLEQQRTEDLERRDSLQQECDTRSLQESQLSEAVRDASSKAQANAALLEERIRKRSEAEQQLEQFHAALPNTRQEFDADPAGFRYRLNERLTLLLRLQKKLKETEQQLEQLESQRPQLETDKQAAEKEFQERKQEQERATEELTRLQQQLRDLLEDRSIEQFQRELEDQQKSAQTQVDSARETKSQANLAEARAQSQHQSLHKQLTQAQQAEKSATDLLHRWLADFSPGLNLDDALVELQELMGYDSAWIDAEQADLKKLDREVQEAAGKIQSCKERLENHRQRRTDERDEAAIEAALEAQQETVKSSSEELQDVERALKNDDETRGRNTAIQAEIEAAKAKAQPWFDLDQLIGSADGKKFTLMAQRFTLDRLLQHANVQLRELARRYRLERLGESLNLAVIDQDLGDERRSVHSLSGGETFLVSLALALGLASLTSSRLRIESLFIDEGFGSLDEDTLEVAMNALNHLQSQGRKVGVITHVERMQDAITTQIQVRRGPGGASRIVLPQRDGRGDSEAVTQ
ncbi:MAG: SbcC/MukB-like Walker B domain-containing protein [Planctomycetota bacterium]